MIDARGASSHDQLFASGARGWALALVAKSRARLRSLCFRALRLSALPTAMRNTLQRKRVTIVLYHDPDPQMFERHLSVLRRLYTIIDLRSFVDALRDRTVGALPDRSLIITFDDGHRGNQALLPVLERAGVPVTIFLCASIVGTGRLYWFKHVKDPQPLKRVPDAARLELLAARGIPEYGEDREALSDDEIEQMAHSHVDFQSHGLSHPILPRCDDDKARAEIVDSRHQLEARYGFDVYAFSYPNGDYSERELALVREAGYRCAVTTEAGFNSAKSDPYRLKRVSIDDPDGVDELLVKTSGTWAAIRQVTGGVSASIRRIRRVPPAR